MPLPTRKLGRTNLDVTVLGFGSAPLGDIYEVLDDATAIATVETAAEAGVTLFDSAPLYGQGSAEHRVGTALRRRPPGSFVLSSKVGRLLTPAPGGRTKTTRYVGGLSFNVVHDYTYDAAMRSHEHSLHRFGLPKVDMLLIHDADAWSHGPVEGPKRYREAMERGLPRAGEAARREGDHGHRHRRQRSRLRGEVPARGRFRLHAAGGPLLDPGAAGAAGGAAAGGREARRRDAGRRVQLRDTGHRTGRGRTLQLRAGAARDPGARAQDRARVRRPRRAAADGRHALLSRRPGGREPRARRSRRPRR